MLNSAKKRATRKIKKEQRLRHRRPGPACTAGRFLLHCTPPAVVAINFQRRRKPAAFRVRGKRLDTKASAKVLEEQYLELVLTVGFAARRRHTRRVSSDGVCTEKAFIKRYPTNAFLSVANSFAHIDCSKA